MGRKIKGQKDQECEKPDESRKWTEEKEHMLRVRMSLPCVKEERGEGEMIEVRR